MCPKFSNPKFQIFRRRKKTKNKNPFCKNSNKYDFNFSKLSPIMPLIKVTIIHKMEFGKPFWARSSCNDPCELNDSSTITDRRCTKILVLSYFGAHLTFESHPCILRSFLKRTEVLGPRAAPSYSRERWREYDPRSEGRCPTRVETSCVSKKTTLHPCPCTCFPRFSTI